MRGFLHCERCSETFDSENASRMDVTEHRADRHDRPDRLEIFHVLTCPECGSEDLEALSACVDCGERPALIGYDECASCLHAQEPHSNNGRAIYLESTV